MSRKCLIACFILVLAAIHLSAQETITPTPIDESLIATPPFSYNGVILASGASGSGSMVGKGVMSTAGHVVYDESNFQWIAPGVVQYYPGWNEARRPNPNFPINDNYYTPVAFYRWSEYSTRVQEDDSGPGLSTPDTFNLDFAVGYFSITTNDDALIQHAELNIDGDGEVSVLRHPREKMVVGYPQDIIPDEDYWLMHMTQPANYTAWDAIYEDYDSGGLWASVYNLDNVTTYSGNSGGPIYVRDDMDNWMMAGVIDGSNGSTGMLIRAIDDNAYYDVDAQSPGMIKQAIMARNGDALMRVEDLQVTGTASDSVELSWTDASSQETGYVIFRQETGTFEEIATLSADSNSFVDDTVQPGHVYHYRVQAYHDLTNPDHRNKAPKSPPAVANVPGIHAGAASFLGTNTLQLSSTGDSSWFVDNARLRAGIVRSMGSSSLVLNIVGPGTLSFNFSSSCEVNHEYSTPGAQYEGEIYDAIWLYMDDAQVRSGDEPVFLSGLVGPAPIQLDVPEGAHQIEWRYAKDPYTDEYQDTGYLDSLTWEPVSAPHPVFGATPIPDSTWYYSDWFGMYEAQHLPWVYHEGLGWLYLLGGTSSGGLYFHCPDPLLGNLYTSPEYWPFIYQVGTDSWFYYFAGSNYKGTTPIIWDFISDQLFLIRN